MREIKFRGKKISDGKWVHGYLTKVENDYAVIEYDNEDGRYNHLVYANTVGQYTGLKDANGKDIYEGDIIVVKELHDGDEDCWNNNEQRPIPQVVAWDEGYKSFNFGGCYRITESPRHFAVIGNIHDNPELL